MFAPEDRWIWDFWFAVADGVHHMFFLQAPKSLEDAELRHRNATIGHATSTDLISWEEHGTALEPGGAGAIDETATWTGSVVQGPDGIWRMYYTGSVRDAAGNTQTIALATSPDLSAWTKHTEFALSADARWYERRGTSSWHEEAWRDPWVFRGTDGQWHMLITARSNEGPDEDRGVIGHAISRDLDEWEVLPPLTEPGMGFGQLEVPQLTSVDGGTALVFSTGNETLAPARRVQGATGGVWWAPATSSIIALDRAAPLTSEGLYSGKITRNHRGADVLLAFATGLPSSEFTGAIVDPLPTRWVAGRLETG